MPALGHVYWRGFLRLQLVSINVDIYAATEAAAAINFNQIHKPSGQRVRYQKVVPGLARSTPPTSSRATRSSATDT